MFSLLGRPRGIAALASTIAIIAASAAHAQEAFVSFDIPAQPLSAALLEFSRQADIPVGVDPALVNGKSAPAVRGSMTPTEALNRLLAGSGLIATRRPEGGFVLAEADATRLGDAGQAASRDVAYGEIVVTGTRIKGVTDQFFPVTQIGREEMDLAGYANVSDVFDDLPQNFGGGTSLRSPAGSVSGAGGASVNLRGLGNEGTLVLLNNRRLAPGGLAGNFVDISSIPASAIDRIEVMSDGASAIYGSDAIAGVVNIILREDFDGAESRLYLSTITDGGGDTIKVGQTVGFSGERAHGLITYEYSSEEELNADDKDFAATAVRPTWLLPFSQKHSILASGGAMLSDRVRLSADGYYNHRYSKSFFSSSTIGLFQTFQPIEIDQYVAAAGVDIRLFGDWEASLSGSYSKSTHDSTQVFLHSAAGNFDTDDATSDIATADLTFGGSLFAIADEPVRAVIGGHYRSESVDQVSRAFSPINPSGGVQHSAALGRDVYAVFGEVYAPIVTEAKPAPFIRRLAVTAAARYDEYSDVGSSFDPKFGVVWSPVEGLNVRGTYGTSFRAARLEQLRNEITSLIMIPYIDPASPTGESLALFINGRSGQLDPEQAETWTVGFDFTPPTLDALRLRATYFNVVYNDRIGLPTLGIAFGADGGPRYQNYTGIIERNPSAARIDDLLSRAGSFVNADDFFNYVPPLDINNVTVIIDGSPQNLAASAVEGFDMELAYGASTDFGDWNFILNGTYLLTYTEQPNPTSSVQNLLDTFNNPVDLRLRSGVNWQRGGVAAGLYVNYVDDYVDDEALSGLAEIDSWTTVDASLRFEIGDVSGASVFEGVSFIFSVANLFDEDPPAIELSPSRLTIYDARNADPSGRRIGVLLTTRW